MKFDTWYLMNRDKIAALAAIWFLPKKVRDFLLTFINTFDKVYNSALSFRSASVDDDRPPIIPIIIIGPDGQPIPNPKPPKPPVTE